MSESPVNVAPVADSPAQRVVADLLRYHNMALVVVVASGLLGLAAHDHYGVDQAKGWRTFVGDAARVVAPLAALLLVMFHTDRVSGRLTKQGGEVLSLSDPSLLEGFRATKRRTIQLFSLASFIAAVATALCQKRLILLLIPVLLLLNVRPRMSALEYFAAVIGAQREEEKQ